MPKRQPHSPESSLILTVGIDAEADRYFESLGAPARTVSEAIYDSEFARDNCRRYHPPGFGGTMSWGEATCRIAELLVPIGWVQVIEGGLIRLMNPAESDAINVQQGDEWTGLRSHSPHLRYPRDGHLAEVMEVGAQMPLPTMGHLVPPPRVRVPKGTRTWILLRFRADDSEVVRYELSLPRRIDDEGDVVTWGVRLLFPSMDLSSDPRPGAGDLPGPDADGAIDVLVARK
jgi:hypothetical protein